MVENDGKTREKNKQQKRAKKNSDQKSRSGEEAFEQFLLNNPHYKAFSDLLSLTRGESPRGMFLVVSAQFSDMLARAIHNLLNDGAGLRNIKRNDHGAISTFSTQIDLAHALGIITDTEHGDLHLIRRIRNHFAHEASAVLDDKKIIEYIDKLSDSDGVLEIEGIVLRGPDYNADLAIRCITMRLADAVMATEEIKLPAVRRKHTRADGKIYLRT